MADDIRKVRVRYAKCPNMEGEQFGTKPHWLLADWTTQTIAECRRNAAKSVRLREPLKPGLVSSEESERSWTEVEPDPYDDARYRDLNGLPSETTQSGLNATGATKKDTGAAGGSQVSEHDHVEKSRWRPWSLANKIQAMIAVIAFAALFVQSWQAQSAASQAKETVEAWRVESGHLNTHSNSDPNADPKNTWASPWTPWVDHSAQAVVYVGVQKRITFAKPFKKIPRVSTALSLIQMPGLDVVLSGLGYREQGTAVGKLVPISADGDGCPRHRG
jgi:hypothetical protein